MRKTLPILIGLLFVSVVSAYAVSTGDHMLPMEQRGPDDMKDEAPFSLNQGVRADTFWFGDYTYLSGLYYARAAKNDKASVQWTFDRGNGPPDPGAGVPLLSNIPMFGNAIQNGAGWFVQDASANVVNYFAAITSALDLGAYPAEWGGSPVLPPILRGTRSLWVGIDEPGADALCWTCGAGYGNDWCQRAVSPAIAYNGTGTVTLSMVYFNDAEECYDGTQVYLKRADTVELLLNQHTGGCSASPGWETNGGGWTGQIGIDSVGPGIPFVINPVTWTSQTLSSTEITGGPQALNFIIEFITDGGLSTEDCRGEFIWGGFACDNVAVGGTGVTPATYTFETGLEGWTPGVCIPVGDYADVVFLDPLIYEIQDPCSCKLENNVLEFAADDGFGNLVHPVGQHIFISGPICNLSAEVGMPTLKVIFMDFDEYAELPQENGVLIRPCWRYYPFLCEITSTTDWSAVVGQSAFNYRGADPVCTTWRYGGTQVTGDAIPPSASMVIPMIELLANCDTFAITNCTGNSNFTPLYDNMVVGVTGGVNAPSIAFENGTQFQDVGSFPIATFDVRAPGPANIVYDKNMDNDLARDKCGDSLIVAGPLPGSDANNFYEVKMWWRIAKRGAFQADTESPTGVTAYKTWKDRVADGLAIDRPYRPEFTFGVMDSIQIGVLPQKNRFLSRFSEKDDDFVSETKAGDMLPDDVFRPGTRIEYFFTANYLKSPNDKYFYPDTLGGTYAEFEVLPGVRTANVANCGGTGLNYCAYHPATLFVRGYNVQSRFFIENALRTILNGYAPCTVETGCTIPYDRNWDRYDYRDASSNWNAPLARGPISGSNNGMTLNQLLGYRSILINLGNYGGGAMQDWDFNLFDQWLISPDCNANVNRQLFAINGDKVGEVLETWSVYGTPFMNNTLAATLFCDAFNGVTLDVDCGTEDETAYCVQLQQVGASSPYFPTLIDVDAYGSWCPNLYGFNVYTPNTGVGGTGNRIYQAEGGKTMSHAQVIRYNSGSSANYKTVLDGVSWHHLSKRNGAGTGDAICPRTTADIVEGSLAEIRAAMRWGFDVADDASLPKLANVKDLATCQNTWFPGGVPADVGDEAALRVNRLFQNEPNPFSPRTTIKFSLAQSGPVQIVIYDVNGRQVKKLVDGPMDPGSYSVVWDGTNDMSHRVGSGVYWSQMKAGSFVSNKKMVVLK